MTSSDLQPVDFLPGVPDWSTVHQPLGELFNPVEVRSAWSEFLLDDDQVARYWRDGFLTNVRLLTAEQCDRILADYQHFTGVSKIHPGIEMMYEFHSNQSGDPDNVLMHALGQWRLTKLFHDLVFLPQAVGPASQLLDERRADVGVRLWHDQMFAKPAHHGGVVAWHQDYSYWTRTKPMMHLTVHIALDEQTDANGQLMYVPGSHRWTRNDNPLPVTDFNFYDMDSIQTVLTEEEKAHFKPVGANLEKGCASFHHPLTVHGSYSNRSDKPRRATVLNYFADGVMSDTDREQLKGITIPKGQKMSGQFFPLVYDPSWRK